MTNLGAISYAAAGALFVVLAGLLLTSWRGRLRGGLFVGACAASAVWAFSLAYFAATGPVPVFPSFVLEVIRDAVWLTFLAKLLSGERSTTLHPVVRYGIHALWMSVLVIGGWLSLSAPFAARTNGVLLFFLLFVLSLAGLLLVEQLYRNTRVDRRWAIKFLCFGLGGLFAFDVYLYSHGLLFRQLDLEIWAARGAINALIVPLLAVAAARNPVWSGEVFVSRHIVFYTTTLIGVGLYLLAMAVGGYLFKQFGGSWGTFAQLVFLFLAVLVLFAVLFSGQARSWLRVFLTKHFFTYKYDYREEWIGLIDAMSASSEELPLQERAIIAVARIKDARGGGLWMRQDTDHFAPVAGDLAGHELPTASSDSSLIGFLRQRQWIIDLDEYRQDPGRYMDLEIPEWLMQMDKAWLIVPLMHGDELMGFLLLGHARAPQPLNWEDYDVLRAAGRQVASYLAQAQAATELAETQQFQAYNRLTAFIMHDLKNLIAQQSLVVKNAAKHKDNPAFVEDAIATIDNSVQRMRGLLEQLRRGEAAETARKTNLARLCEEVVARHAREEPEPHFYCDAERIEVRVEESRLAAILGHVIKNAQDATSAEGRVDVRVGMQDSHAVISVDDNGSGMDSRFVRERLFRPFDTTKGSKGMGIGAYQAREFVRSLGGDIDVESKPGVGTRFTIRLPLANRGEEDS